MARATLQSVFIGFVAILLLIAAVKYLFPTTIDGFRDVTCYGVTCKEGEFCQDNVCRPINPPYTNDYYNKGYTS